MSDGLLAAGIGDERKDQLKVGSAGPIAHEEKYGPISSEVGPRDPDDEINKLREQLKYHQIKNQKIDAWAGRSSRMKCRTCIYCVPKRPLTPLGAETTLGRCRRHAPTMQGFPVVVLDVDWCGDHKLNEDSI